MTLGNHPRRAGIFVFFDKDGTVDRYVEYLLRDLRENLDYLVVICNGRITTIGRGKLQSLCNEIYVRENVGLDAGAFRDGLLKLYGWEKLEKYDEIVLVNDTFYGPIYPFSQIFQEMDAQNVDFWGLTEHFEAPGKAGLGENGVYPSHIQTYFLAVRKSMFSCREFHEYWENMSHMNSFDEVVGHHEVIFTKHFRDLGFRGVAYCDLTDLKEESGLNINYYAFLPGTLVKERKFCVIKRKNFVLEQSELLVHSGGEELREAMEYVQFHTDYDVSMIWENLLRLYELPQLKQSLHLNYVLPKTSAISTQFENDAAVVIGCTHEVLFSKLATLVQPLRKWITVCLLTDTEEKADILRKLGLGIDICVSAEMTWWNYCKNRKYICYIHDAVATHHGTWATGRSYRYQLVENLIPTRGYIQNVLQLFAAYPQLGVLVPPLPYHGMYYRFWGQTWGPYLEHSIQLASQLNLHHLPGSGAFQPITIDDSGWYRQEVLDRLEGVESCSHEALCRIMQLVAQDCGYYSGWVMTTDYASLEVSNLQYMAEKLGQLWHQAIPAERFAEVLTVAQTIQGSVSAISLKMLLKLWLKKVLPKPVFCFLRKIWKRR